MLFLVQIQLLQMPRKSFLLLWLVIFCAVIANY
jgi:hypothetical protein